MAVFKYKFDFDVGTLVKSPCKECKLREKEFPKCMELCKLLDQLQRKLTETRSTARNKE